MIIYSLSASAFLIIEISFELDGLDISGNEVNRSEWENQH